MSPESENQEFRIWEWLRTVSHGLGPCAQFSVKSLNSRTVEIECGTEVVAQELLRQSGSLQAKTGAGINLVVEGVTYDFRPPLDRLRVPTMTDLKIDLSKTPGLIGPLLEDFTQNRGTVATYRLDDGFTCEEIVPFLGYEPVLNKPRAELIGKPAANSKGVIGETKLSLLRESMELPVGESLRGSYTYDWVEGNDSGIRLWRKELKLVKISESMAAIFTENEDFAIQYWKRRMASLV